MPELRKDPILGRWIIIAQERGKRPTDFLVDEFKVKGGFCPLCPGNEKTTPDEVFGLRARLGLSQHPGLESARCAEQISGLDH